MTLQLEDDTGRFTPAGRIAVVDAIYALSESDSPERIWKILRRNHPDIANLCTDFNFFDSRAAPVADSEGWESIQALLLDHLLESDPE